MNRRRALAGIASGLAAGLSGCVGGLVGGPADERTASRTPPEEGSVSIAEHGYPSDICDTEVIEGFSIRAIVEPVFAEAWEGHGIPERYRFGEEGPGLGDAATVVGVTRDGRARAYPVAVLWVHEIVNDTFGGPLLVTYCSICQSGMVAERTVDGSPTVFGVSGQLWRPPDVYQQASALENRSFGASVRARNGTVGVEIRNRGNLVLFDRATRSFWSQLLARAICGPQAGTELGLAPFELTTWGEWRGAHPGTEVLLPPPHSGLMDTGNG